VLCYGVTRCTHKAEASAPAYTPLNNVVVLQGMEYGHPQAFALLSLPAELVLEVLRMVRWQGCLRDWASLWYVSHTMRRFVTTAFGELLSVGDLGWSVCCSAPAARELSFLVAVQSGMYRRYRRVLREANDWQFCGRSLCRCGCSPARVVKRRHGRLLGRVWKVFCSVDTTFANGGRRNTCARAVFAKAM
jgi:hypothetical protein